MTNSIQFVRLFFLKFKIKFLMLIFKILKLKIKKKL